MIPPDVFLEVPVLTGPTVRLEPLSVRVLDDYLAGLADPEVRRLTGSSTTFAPAAVEHWLRTRHEQPDRADWAVLRRSDGAFLGEAVLHELDRANASVGFRIWLAGPAAVGHGHGTEATALAVGHAFSRGLHRVGLGVYAFNLRARRAYARCGFVEEGVLRDALRWDGAWHDEIRMSLLATDARGYGR